jgi:hypothetical protein
MEVNIIYCILEKFIPFGSWFLFNKNKPSEIKKNTQDSVGIPRNNHILLETCYNTLIVIPILNMFVHCHLSVKIR